MMKAGVNNSSNVSNYTVTYTSLYLSFIARICYKAELNLTITSNLFCFYFLLLSIGRICYEELTASAWLLFTANFISYISVFFFL